MPNTVNFGSSAQINPYGIDLADIERRRALAQALQQQGTTPLGGTEMAGQVAIQRSPFEGLAKLGQAYAGAQGQKRASEQERALGERYQSDLNSTLAQALQAGTGSSATTLPEGVQGPNMPAQAPDRARMAQILMQHPATQGIGAQQLVSDINRQALVAALGGGSPQSISAPPSASGQPAVGQSGQPTQSGPAVGGPAGGVPMAAWIQADPSGKSYMEQLAKDNAPVNVRPGGAIYQGGKVVFNQPQVAPGINLNYGANGPSASPIPGMAQAQDSLGTTPMQEVTNADQTKSYIPKAQLATAARQSPIPQSQPPAPSGAPTMQIPPEVQAQRDAEARKIIARESMPNGGGAIPTNTVISGAPKFGQTQEEQIRQAGMTAANTEAGREFIKKQSDNYEKLRDVPATLANMGRARTLATTEAKNFMGPFGESKLAITKFMRSNLPGMQNLKTEGVTNAEELQSTLFNQVMDNLKKMDASPSQYQQQVMQEAFGTLRTDPQSVPKIIDVFSDILKNRVSIHNDTVTSAESRGTTFPYDVRVRLPDSGLTAQEQQELSQLRSRFGKK